jgi:NADH-quinone oxidoreductase subunit H
VRAIGQLIYRSIPAIVLVAVALVFVLFAVFRLEWLEGWFDVQVPDLLSDIVSALFVAVIGVLPVVLLTWLERKVVARIQDRIGPNVQGPYGMIVAIADAIKMFTKEDTTPVGVDRVMFNAAPILMGASMWMVYGVLPFAPKLIGVDLPVALLYVMALGSVTDIAVLMAGWSSNNKYALLGAFRNVAQLVSYEIPQALALITPIMLAGTMSTVGIIEAQDVAYIVVLPLSAFIFFVSSIAETARTPFDLLEAESEIVAGFHIEYSGMKFALFFIAEYGNMFAASMLTAVVFLGGYRLFGLEEALPFLAPVIMLAKALVVVFIFLWMRGTLPRLRIDQLLAFNWKFMVPLSLLNIVVVAIVTKVLRDAEASTGLETLVLLAANILMFVVAWGIPWLQDRRARQRDEVLSAAVTAEPAPVAASH